MKKEVIAVGMAAQARDKAGVNDSSVSELSDRLTHIANQTDATIANYTGDTQLIIFLKAIRESVNDLESRVEALENA